MIVTRRGRLAGTVWPWPAVTAVLWGIIGLAGLWLGLLGIAMAVGLARVLRSGAEIPERYWRLWADPVIHAIHMRVLRHVAALAEARELEPSSR